MEVLLSLDTAAFIRINTLPHSPVLDTIALFLSGIGGGGIIWLLIGIGVFFRVEKTNHWFFMPLVGGLLGSWFLAEVLLKNFFKRARPFVDLSVTLVGSDVSGYSFPSSHATTAFAMAVVLANFLPRLRLVFYFLALAVSLSRVYMGVHYPLDGIVGALLGAGIGKVALMLTEFFKTRVKKKSRKR